MFQNDKQIESIIMKVIEDENLKKTKSENYNVLEINLNTANKIAMYAQDKAIEMKVPVVISIVDAAGNIVLLHRMDDSLLASIDISLNKAYTSVSLRMSTDKLQELCKPNGELYGLQNSNKRFVIFAGGMPIEYKGKVIGAIGISGGTTKEDKSICEYAMEKIMCDYNLL